MADSNSSISGSGNLVTQQFIVQATARTRANLSVLHLLSACLFSKQVHALEEQNNGKELGAFWEDILANATASVLLAAAALESYVNELFADHQTHFPSLRADVVVKLWEAHETKPFLDKVDLILLLRDRPSINRDVFPTQDIVLLMRLRNALTHFKPEWFGEQQAHAKLSAQLAGHFEGSGFFPKGEPMFPRGWAGHSCTAWTLKATIEFIKELENQADLPKRLAQFETRFIY